MSRANEVFLPGSLPESTYITRKTPSGFTYEDRLKQALSVSGYLTLISGPSKIGGKCSEGIRTHLSGFCIENEYDLQYL